MFCRKIFGFIFQSEIRGTFPSSKEAKRKSRRPHLIRLTRYRK